LVLLPGAGEIRGYVHGADRPVVAVGDEAEVREYVADTGDRAVGVHHLSPCPYRVVTDAGFSEGRDGSVFGEEIGEARGLSAVHPPGDFQCETCQGRVVGLADEVIGVQCVHAGFLRFLR
jgi:hypothetical protein